MAGTLDRDGQRTLMLRAGALLAASLDLTPVGHVAPNASDVLVIDFADVVHAEGAHFATGRVTPASATTGSRAAIVAAPSASRTWAAPAETGPGWGLGTTVIGSWRVLVGTSLFGHRKPTSLSKDVKSVCIWLERDVVEIVRGAAGRFFAASAATARTSAAALAAKSAVTVASLSEHQNFGREDVE